MAFVGILSDYKSFENIRENLKNKKELNINLIHINRKSIENIKNIKFETIVLDANLKDFEETAHILEKLYKNIKYLIINTDINNLLEEDKNFEFAKSKNMNLEVTSEEQVITYGLNRSAKVTVSSITESGILIYLQKNIKNTNGKIIEVSEKLFKTGEKSKLKNYEILIIYVLSLLYSTNIISE